MFGTALAEFFSAWPVGFAADPPVDWRGISYVLSGVIAVLGGVIVKLYKDGKKKDRALAQAHADHEEYLKELLEHLTP